MAKETFAPNATISDTTEKTALSTNALTVASCDPDMTKTDVSTTLNTLAQTPLSKNLHLHPPFEFPRQKLLKSHTSLPTDQAATPPLHQMESEKEDAKGRNPNGKGSRTMSTEAFPNNSGKWMKNMTKNSRTFPSLLITRSNMMTPPTPILMANQTTLKIFDFQWNLKYSRRVMLRFSPYSVLLVTPLTYFSYLFGWSLSQQTISHHIWHICLLTFTFVPRFIFQTLCPAYITDPCFLYKYQTQLHVQSNLFLPIQ